MVDKTVLTILLDAWVREAHPDLTTAESLTVVTRLLPAQDVEYAVLLEEREAVVDAVRRARK